MKFGVVIFPGSNCDQDIIHVLKNVLGQEMHELWHKQDNIEGFTENDCIVLPGGFSYGDYLRSGAIASHSRIMKSVIEHANNGGYVLGICNGFQILCESGLLPGALLHNDNQQFICKNTYLKPDTLNTAITAGLDLNKAYKIPIAHAEGRFYADDTTLQELENNNQILFKYCDAQGRVANTTNPNGSVMNIAGICNANRNVFGMMPHPERASEAIMGNTDGIHLFQSLLQAANVMA